MLCCSREKGSKAHPRVPADDPKNGTWRESSPDYKRWADWEKIVPQIFRTFIGDHCQLELQPCISGRAFNGLGT